MATHFPALGLRLDPPVIGSFFPSHGEDRIVLEPDDVPPLLKEGLKAVEDKTFDTHIGFSGGDVAPMIPGSRFRVFD